LKILLDHNLDRRLKDSLSGYETATTQDQGWSDALNGELLSLAERNGFDVLLTADSNIKDQQNLSNRKISLLILRARDNRLTTHLEMIDDIISVLSEMQQGDVVEVFHKKMQEN
jgi:predicted nuclease of predicted toxin-antitoxin system